MQPRTLLPFLLLALGVSAVPALVKRDDVPNYVNDDGSIDFSALTADAAIVPTIVAPAQATNVILTIDAQAVSEEVVSQAADQADTPAKRAILAKRASSPAWAGYETCGAQTLFTQAKTVSNPDTADAFRADTSFAQAAKTAKKPSGYTLEYVALNGVYQSSTANSFLGSTTLTSAQGYNPQYCATYCDTKVKGCLGFNIYYERDPPINLDGKSTDFLSQCNNPPSVTTIACQFYGSPVNAAAATSTGQVRGNYFRTAKAGSNGYSKATYVAPTITGFQAPLTFSGGKIDNQKVVGKIAGTHLLTVNPDFNPQYCADVANKYYTGKYSSFETFMLKKNGAYAGQGCIVLTQGGYTSADANDAGQFGGKSSTYDETSVWYSSQPVYYYEAPTVVKFEDGSFDPAKSIYVNKGIVTVSPEIENFRMSSSNVMSSTTDSDNAVVWQGNPTWWPLKIKEGNGNYVTCNYGGNCNFWPQGFTFDFFGLDMANLATANGAGNVIVKGYRSGQEVASTTLAGTGSWQTYKVDGSQFSKLDRLYISGPGVPAMDNMKIIKYATSTETVKRESESTSTLTIRDDEETFTIPFTNGTTIEVPTSCAITDLIQGLCDTTQVV